MHIIYNMVYYELIVNNVFYILFLLFLTSFYFYFKQKYSYWKDKNAYYLRPIWPFGNFKDLLLFKKTFGDCLRDLYNMTEYPYSGIYFLTKPAILIKDPQLIKCILVKDFNNFVDRGIYLDEEKEPTSTHLFRMRGEKWKNMRMKLSPAFTAGKNKTFFPVLLGIATKLDEHLQKCAKKEQIIDVKDICRRYTADIIASVIMGLEIDSFNEPENEFILAATNYFKSYPILRMLKAILAIADSKFLHVLNLKTVEEEQEIFITKVVEKVVNYRKENNVMRNDLMQLLIQLLNTGEITESDNINNHLKTSNKQNAPMGGITFNDISAQAFTFFFAGFETSTIVLTFLLYECALNKDIQIRIQNNIDTVLKNHDGAITYESLSEMDYVERALAESLRKYPVVPFLTRDCNKDYVIPETEVKISAGTKVYISIEGLQYDPKYFPDPHCFDPDRFLPENCTKRHPYSYLPFGEGPRHCIGIRLGKLMSTLATVIFFRKYSVHLSEKSQVPIIFDKFTYGKKPLNSVFLKICPRL